MPANPGQVNQVDLTAPGHVLRFTEADAKLLRDATLHQAGPEPIHIIQLHIHHKVFGKGTVIEMLQQKLAAIAFKTGHAAGIPQFGKSEGPK